MERSLLHRPPSDGKKGLLYSRIGRLYFRRYIAMLTSTSTYDARIEHPTIFREIHTEETQKLIDEGSVVLYKNFRPGCTTLALLCAVDPTIARNIRSLIPQKEHGRFAAQKGDSGALREYLESFNRWDDQFIQEEIEYLFF